MTQPVDREREALVAIVEAILADRLTRALVYHTVWTYRVTGSEEGPPVTISAKSQDPRVPDLARIVLRQGPDGGYATPAGGSLISVGFLNADPSLPYVHSLDPTATVVNAWEPAQTKRKLTGGGPAAARVGDQVNGGYLVFITGGPLAFDSVWPGTPAGLASAQGRITALSPNGLLIALGDTSTGTTSGLGTIVTGSTKTEIGP